MAMLEVKRDTSIDESLIAYKNPKANNRNNTAHDRNRNRNRNRNRHSCSNTSQLGSSNQDSQVSMLKDRFIKPLSIICVMVTHASVASSKHKEESD